MAMGFALQIDIFMSFGMYRPFTIQFIQSFIETEMFSDYADSAQYQIIFSSYICICAYSM